MEARIEDLGPRQELDDAERQRQIDEWYAELGPMRRTWIEILPFQVERFGVEFGLIPQPPEEEGNLDGHRGARKLPGVSPTLGRPL